MFTFFTKEKRHGALCFEMARYVGTWTRLLQGIRCWSPQKSLAVACPTVTSSCVWRTRPVTVARWYGVNPVDRRPMDELLAGISGGRGGRGGRGRKKGGRKGVKGSRFIYMGKGKANIAWPGLTTPLGRSYYKLNWLNSKDLGPQPFVEGTEASFLASQLEGAKQVERRVSEQNWSQYGWSGRKWGGRYVGCPEAPDGTPLTEFASVVIELGRVANQTKAGKKRTVRALVVVGNGKGAAGYAIGKGEEMKTAIRKAKNKAVNCLQFIPRCGGNTVYHDLRAKKCQTTIVMEKQLPGHGLHCHRAIAAICTLAGLKDLKAKVIGSTNLTNVVRAAFKGLAAQETHQELADRNIKFMVELRREAGYRPGVCAVPKHLDTPNTTAMLRELKVVRL